MTDAWRQNELVGWKPPRTDELFGAGEIRPRVTNALGVDVASYQGSPNWSQVASTRQFVYVKAGQGTGTSYPSLDGQYNGAISAGMTAGLYWYADPTQSAEANADAFSQQINRLKAASNTNLPPCLDLEVGSGDLSGWAQQFITRLRADTGCVRVMVYSSASFFKNQIGEGWMDDNIALWIANFGAPPGQPSYLTPRVAIHQYADDGEVTGISGKVDLDYAIWDLAKIVPGISGGSSTVTTPTNTSVFTPTEEGALLAIYQQLSGSPTVGQWTGWPSWQGGSGRSLTLVDYARQADTQLCALAAAVAALQAEVDMIKQSIDPAQIASAVAAQLAAKLAS